MDEMLKPLHRGLERQKELCAALQTLLNCMEENNENQEHMLSEAEFTLKYLREQLENNTSNNGN